MDFLKDLLGDKYDEFAELLGDTKLRIDDGEHMIPKSRFDEINGKYKDTKRELEDILANSMSAEEKVEAQLKEAEEAKVAYQKELSKLKATEVFVKAGLEEKEYVDLVEGIATENTEATVEMATLMANVINQKKVETEKLVKKELLNKTPEPPKGDDPDGEKTLGEKFAESANKQASSDSKKTIWE